MCGIKTIDMRNLYLLSIFLLSAFYSSAQVLKYKKEFSPKVIQNEQFFGYNMVSATNKNLIFASASKDNKGAVRSGAVYLFKAIEGEQLLKLKSPQVRLNEAFGYSLALQGEELLVGAPGWNRFFREEGRVYVFTQNEGGENNWGDRNRLIPTESQARDLFGYALAIHGDFVFVGAPGHQKSQGAVFVFHRKIKNKGQWEQVAKIEPDTNSEFFGSALAFDGETLVVGAPRERDGSGALYFYEPNDTATRWNLIKEIKPERRIYLGLKVEIQDGICAVTTADGVSGKVNIYEQDKGGEKHWGEVVRLAPKYPGSIHDFGEGIHLKGNYLLIGAPSYDNYMGALYLFQRQENGTWKKCYDTEYSYSTRRDERVGFSVHIYDEQRIFSGGIGNIYKSGKLVEFTTSLDFLNDETAQKENESCEKIIEDKAVISKTFEIVKEESTRILGLVSEQTLPEMELGETHDGFVLLKNLGTETLEISQIIGSENITCQLKQLSIAPKDSYKLSYSYKQEVSGIAFLEFHSNKTAGNNRIELKSIVTEGAHYQLELVQKDELNQIILGDYTSLEIELRNTGNRTIKDIIFHIPNNLKLVSTPKIVEAGAQVIVKLKYMPLILGENEAFIDLECQNNELDKRITIRANSILGNNEMMLQNAGLLSAPGMMDNRLLVNFKFTDTPKLTILIKKMGGQVIRRFKMKNDRRMHCIPTEGLAKDTYTVSVVDLKSQMSISQTIFTVR